MNGIERTVIGMVVKVIERTGSQGQEVSFGFRRLGWLVIGLIE